MVADDLGRLGDVLGEVADGIAVAGAGQVRAGVAALAAEEVAVAAEHGGEHGFSLFEVPLLEPGFCQRDNFVGGVVFAGAFRGDDRGGGDGRDGGGERFERGALGLVGNAVGEGEVADGVEKLAEAVAAIPRCGGREPAEIRLAELGSPAGAGLAKCVGIGDRLAVRTAALHAGDGFGIPVVAGEHRIGGDGDVGIPYGGEQRDEFSDDGGRVHGNQQRGELAVHEGVGVREQRIEARGDFLTDLRRGLAHAGENELPGADVREMEVFRELRKIEPAEGGDDFRLERLVSDAGEGDERLDGRLRIGLGEGIFLPLCDRLPLDGSAGGEAQEAVLAGQVRPRLGERLRTIGFQQVPEFRLGGGWCGLSRSGGLAAGVGDPIERSLAAAATGGEIHGAVLFGDDDVGEGHRLAGDELLLHGFETGAVRLVVDRPHGAERPVEGEEGVLIFRWEFRARAEDRSGGRAGADVDGGGQRIGIISRPAAGSGAPAVVAAADDVIDAGGHVPRRSHVPLHVGVVGEELAVRIEGRVILVAEAAGEELDVFPVGIGFADVSAGGEDALGVAVRIPHARREMVLAGGDHAVVGEIFRHVGVVAADEEDGFSVR